MKAEVQELQITINKDDALSIYNALLRSMPVLTDISLPEYKGAIKLKKLLQSNFYTSQEGRTQL